MLRDVADADWMRLALEESQQAPSLRQRADPRALLGREARRDEELHDTLVVEHTERGVTRARDAARLVGHLL